MIVEDRPVFREYLKASIDWGKYGFEICCEAKHGEEALELASQYLPDIVLTDINMPIMDGLELSEALVSQYPETSIVLITGYSEFEYARKAIKLGVSDYILKPFEKEELILTLLKIKDNLQISYENKLSADDENALMISGLLESAIHSTTKIYTEEVDKFPEFSNYQFVCIISAFKDQNLSEDFIFWRSTVSQLITQMFELELFHHIIEDSEGRIVSIIGAPAEDHDNELFYQKARMEYQKITTLLNKHLSYEIATGISTVHQGLSNLKMCYSEAISAIKATINVERNEIVDFETIPDEHKKHIFYSVEVNDRLIKKLRENYLEGALALLDETYNKFEEMKISSNYAYIVFMGFISLILSFITQSGKRIENVLKNDMDLVMNAKYYTDIEEQREIIKRLITSTINHFSTYKVSRAYKIAQKAKAYIEVHYSDSSLTVSDVAKDQYINETYLRKMFKTETGYTITEYITDIRMTKAKALMASGNIKLSDVAELIGYNDAGYFSRAFKKYYGISPSQFKI